MAERSGAASEGRPWQRPIIVGDEGRRRRRRAPGRGRRAAVGRRGARAGAGAVRGAAAAGGGGAATGRGGRGARRGGARGRRARRGPAGPRRAPPSRRSTRATSSANGSEPAHLHELQQDEVERHPRVGGAPQLALGAGQQVEAAQQVLLGERAGERAQPLELLGEDGVEERALRGGELHEQDLAQVQEQLAHEVAVVGPVVGEALHELEHGEAVALDDRLRGAVQQLAVHEAEEPGHVRVGDLVAGEGEHLVEERQRVADAALGRAGDEGERRVGDPDLLLRRRRCAGAAAARAPGSSGSRTAGSGRGSSPGSCGTRSWRR